MKKTNLKIILIITMLAIGMVTLTGCTETNYQSNYKNINNTNNIECEHDWCITSEYDWWYSQYRTVSKCSKCGQVIK